MGNVDLVRIFSNISGSLPSIQHLLTGMSYVFGIMFIFIALSKFRESVEGKQGGGAKMTVPFAYLIIGAIMIFMPSTLQTFSNTLFGSQGVLQYSNYDRYNIYDSIKVLVQTAGIIWFVRGCVLLTHASEPQQGQEGSKGMGPKGMTFIFAGILAMNLDTTMGMVDYLLSQLMSISLHNG